MSDVGDVNTEVPVTVFAFGQRNRIVKVTCVRGVDRDDRLAGQVDSTFEVLIIEFVGLFARGVEDCFRELVGESELVDDRLQVDSRLTALAEDF